MAVTDEQLAAWQVNAYQALWKMHQLIRTARHPAQDASYPHIVELLRTAKETYPRPSYDVEDGYHKTYLEVVSSLQQHLKP